jgi:ADP-heptose:LPS heptosyltransferase
MDSPNRILVFRVGFLGDTIAALPSLHALRENFPGAKVTLLHDRPHNAKFIPVEELLNGTGLVDDYMTYPVFGRSLHRGRTVVEILHLLYKIRARHYDLVVHLTAQERTLKQDVRDRRFFRLAGIHRQITTSQPWIVQPRGETLPPEADFLLAGLARAGLRVPDVGEGVMDLHLGSTEEEQVWRWEQENGLVDDQRRRVAFGLGGKTPSQIWPLENYIAVARNLVAEQNILPIVFGGAEDAVAAAQLIASCGCGVNACGKLRLRASARALRDCCLYVGNDTGTTHLAAAAGVRCVAVTSARNPPGRWFPYGRGHVIHRLKVSCEGCRLDVCTVEKLRCLTGISAVEVTQSCARELRQMELVSAGKTTRR